MTNAFTSSGLFGRLFSDDAIAAEFSSETFTRRMLSFESAWTKALAEVGAVPSADADAALKAIKSFSCGGVAGLAAGSDRDGLPVPVLVKALRSGLDNGPAQASPASTSS